MNQPITNEGEPTSMTDLTRAGLLRVHPDNPRYLTTDGEKALWLSGSHTWATFQERGVQGRTPDFDYEEFLHFLKDHHHNFLRLWVWEHAQWMQFTSASVPIRYQPQAYERPGPGQANDGKPRFDLTRFNPAFFDRLEARVRKAGEQGIFVSVMLFQGFSVEQKDTPGRPDPDKGNAWLSHPFHRDNNINGVDGDPDHTGRGLATHRLEHETLLEWRNAYVRKMIDHLNHFDHVLWEIGNEMHEGSVDFQNQVVRTIREYERTRGREHLIGMTANPIDTPTLRQSEADWISPSGRGGYREHMPAAEGDPLIIFDTDHGGWNNPDPGSVWKALVRSNHFVTMDPYMDFRFESPARPVERWEPIRQAMGRAVCWAESIDLAGMSPGGDLCSTGYCLANPGRQYLVLELGDGSESHAPVQVYLEPGAYQGRWYDCIDDTTTRAFELEATESGGWRTLKNPCRQLSLLHLQSR